MTDRFLNSDEAEDRWGDRCRSTGRRPPIDDADGRWEPVYEVSEKPGDKFQRFKGYRLAAPAGEERFSDEEAQRRFEQALRGAAMSKKD